jgi:predicted acylesterase/phospholipase RssA
MAENASELVSLARKTLRERTTLPADEALKLAKRLKNGLQFGLARRVLERTQANGDLSVRRQVLFERALCTYKDSELPIDVRFDLALSALQEVENLSTTTDQETLGIAGAIHKRKWEVDAQKQHLETSLGFYLRGHDQGCLPDRGYTSINAAFLLDLLAEEEENEARRSGGSPEIKDRRSRASAIREELIGKLPGVYAGLENPGDTEKWWLLVTIAEAFFGLGRFDEAGEWIGKAAELAVPDWARESTLKQLIHLAFYCGHLGKENFKSNEAALRALHPLVSGEPGALRGAVVGKVGLALSGGGFRASIFHIGVLARLAELDVLRHISVLSCVSGGSIIGAHLYLEIRQLLRTKKDALITRQDYIELVARIERSFLDSVQKNIRMQAFSSLRASLKMLLKPAYTVTRRIGELLEQEIYSRVQDGEGNSPRYISDLGFIPLGEAENFTPEDHNWRRCAKVPQLIINATTLNTCHNWQFTTATLGEPASQMEGEADGNWRFRRVRYADAPAEYRHVRLGDAVGASACVAGLLPPVLLPNLYPEKMVALVDGGVHDNQGTATLLDADCTVLLISDASRNVPASSDPKIGMVGMNLRTINILMDRLRQARLRELAARMGSARLRGMMFLHLKKEIDSPAVDWIGCDDPTATAGEQSSLTSYGVRRDVQQMVAAVRTDMDTFNDTEAQALMASGYRMADRYFPNSIRQLACDSPTRHPWAFLAVDPMMTGQRESEDFMRIMRVSAMRDRKIWFVSPKIRAMLAGAAVAGFALLAALAAWLSSRGILTERRIGAATEIGLVLLAAWFIVLLIWSKLLRLVHIQKSPLMMVIECGFCLGGWAASWIDMRFFDPPYLAWGKTRGNTGERGPDAGFPREHRELEKEAKAIAPQPKSAI